MAEYHSRIVLPHIHELLSHVDRVETRPQELPSRAHPAAPTEAGCGSGSATPISHYTYNAPLPDLSRFALFPREESDRREQWHQVPRQYTPAVRNDARPPVIASVAAIAPVPAPAPYPSPRSPSHRWPSPTHSHSESRHGSCRCCYGGYAQEGHSPRDYRERDYHDVARAHRDYHENGYGGGVHGEGWYPPGTHPHSGHGRDVYGTGPSASRSAGRHSGGSPVLSEHSRGKKKRPNLSKEAVEIMMSWIDSHIENPFERQDRPELVERTGLEEKQVTDWFTNFRRRKWAKYRVDLYNREIAKWKAVRRAALEEVARLNNDTANPDASPLSHPQANHHHHHPLSQAHQHPQHARPQTNNTNATAAAAAARRAADADAARCAAEQNHARAKDEYERWVGEQRDKRGVGGGDKGSSNHRRKMMGGGLLAGDGDGEEGEEEDEFDEDE